MTEKVLVLGANGATGRLVVQQLLRKGTAVVAMGRSANALAGQFEPGANVREVVASIADLSADELRPYVQGCQAVVCCLGHNLSFKGVYGPPRLLVADAIEKVANAIEPGDGSDKIRLILMNTTGNSNDDIPEKPPLSQRCVVGLLRWLLPPHRDNELAADYLRLAIGHRHPSIEWVAVRPDSLVDDDEVSDYQLVASPTRNAIFDAGATSRINVAHFMSELTVDATLWEKWKGQMPVVYNS